jgi:3-keto-disaccharide hydrolase
MQRTCVAFLVVVLGSAPCLGQTERTFRFTKENVGKLPAGWKAEKTGEGEGSVWKVVADDTAPSKSGHVLAQTAESPRAMFNICVVEDTNLKDVELSVAFKAVKGKVDQGGGVVWRYQDANNYYIARMNPLEENLRVYKVVAGKRIQLATQEELKVNAGEWHTLRIEHTARNEIECYLDGKKLLSVDREATIDKPGKIGLWTKADAQTYFDDLKVRPR